MGFEPTVRLPAHTLSKRAPSTTRTPLQQNNYTSCIIHDNRGCFCQEVASIIDVMPKKKDTPPAIELRGLSKRFGMGDAEHNAINSIDLTVEKGEFVIIMGPSGCGKTTLLNILGLLDRSTEGEYLLEGRSIADLSPRQHARIRSDKIGFIFQSFNLVSRLNIIENVSLPLTYKGIGRTRRLQLASAILKNFHLSEREYYMPWQLSGGQTQRVAIARALVNQPSLILADEPTGNLDSKSSHIVMEELSDIHRRGNTIIMVTHNPELVSYASRVIHMIDGRIESDSQKITVTKKKSVKRRLDSNDDKKTAKRKKKS